MLVRLLQENKTKGCNTHFKQMETTSEQNAGCDLGSSDATAFRVGLDGLLMEVTTKDEPKWAGGTPEKEKEAPFDAKHSDQGQNARSPLPFLASPARPVRAEVEAPCRVQFSAAVSSNKTPRKAIQCTWWPRRHCLFISSLFSGFMRSKSSHS
jgi:hypothetical protein